MIKTKSRDLIDQSQAEDTDQEVLTLSVKTPTTEIERVIDTQGTSQTERETSMTEKITRDTMRNANTGRETVQVTLTKTEGRTGSQTTPVKVVTNNLVVQPSSYT